MPRKSNELGDLMAGPSKVKTKAKSRPKASLQAVVQVPGSSHPGTDRVRIQLEENDNIPPTGQFFGINGRSYMLRPGIAAEVPRELVSILNDAVQDVPEIDPYTNQIVGYRKKLRFPYRVVA